MDAKVYWISSASLWNSIIVITLRGTLLVHHLLPSSILFIHAWYPGMKEQSIIITMDEIFSSLNNYDIEKFYPWITSFHPCMELSSITFCSNVKAILAKLSKIFPKPLSQTHLHESKMNEISIHSQTPLIQNANNQLHLRHWTYFW